MDICVDIFVQTYVFNFLEFLLRNGIAKAYGYSMFNFLRNFQIVFKSSFTFLHSHQKFLSVPVFPHPCQQLLSVSFILAILIGVKWYHIVVFISISLMTMLNIFHTHINHCILYLKKCPFKSLPVFNWIVILFLCSNSSLHILHSLHLHMITNISLTLWVVFSFS